MSRKKRKFETNLPAADRYISDLKFKDLKRECVLRGMEFEMVIKASIPGLSNWLRHHFHDDIDHTILDKFDDWQEKVVGEAMAAKGDHTISLIHPSLRLGYIAEKDEEGNTTKRKRAKTIIGRKKKKRERTADNIFKGTKKAYTFELQKKGHSKAQVITMVTEKFPDAVEKSIGIWFNKSKKLHS